MLHLLITILSILYILLLPKNVYAYIDPGSGSYIFQLIIATLLGMGFAIKIYWRKIFAFFARFFAQKKQDSKDHG